MDLDLQKVKPKPRKSRRKCYASDDASHVCSVNHVRVPAHCRIKRGKGKHVKKEVPLMSSKVGEGNRVPSKPIPTPPRNVL